MAPSQRSVADLWRKADDLTMAEETREEGEVLKRYAICVASFLATAFIMTWGGWREEQ